MKPTTLLFTLAALTCATGIALDSAADARRRDAAAALLHDLTALETRLTTDAASARRNGEPDIADAIEHATDRFRFLREQSELQRRVQP